MGIFNVENRNFRINVVAFNVIGTLYYIYSYLQDPFSIRANPLYAEGAYGIPISIVGASFTYYYFRYGVFAFYRIIIVSFVLFFLWFAAGSYIALNLSGNDNVMASVAWIGLLTIMYFMFIGAVNGLFGYWISLFNLLVLALALFDGKSSDPMGWVSVLDFAGIDNPIFQWGIVIISAFLGISDKGYDFFVNQ